MLQLDTGLGTHFAGLGDVPRAARDAEEAGFGALWIPETKHNPFLPVVLAAEHTQRLRLGTAVAIAFPRSPMVLANIGTPAMLGQQLRERFDGVVDRLFLNLTYAPAAKTIDWPRLVQE